MRDTHEIYFATMFMAGNEDCGWTVLRQTKEKPEQKNAVIWGIWIGGTVCNAIDAGANVFEFGHRSWNLLRTC